jgi:hypothetical protein
MDVRIITQDRHLFTDGLRSEHFPELSLHVSEPRYLDGASRLLEYVGNYMVENDTRVNPGETLAYGSSVVQFVRESEGFLSIVDFPPSPGTVTADAAVSILLEQETLCADYGAEVHPPSPEQLVVVSEGVIDGDDSQGVRYPSPAHMSGWWITTDRYSGDTNDLRTLHVSHVVEARPDIARMLALPNGWRFNEVTGKVYFDTKINN